MFEMKDEYRTGIDKIDEQHARLFEIGERAFQLFKNEFSIDKYDKIVAIVNELHDYAAVHFKDEEEYMQSIGYKRMFTQKIEHAAFMKKFDEIDFRSIDHNPDEFIINILDFIADWLVSHILHQDLLITEK